MNKLKNFLVLTTVITLFACTLSSQKKQVKTAYFLKENISKAELNNPQEYKRYNYSCRHLINGEKSSLATYFPLSRESRLPENFGIYFQLEDGKVYPFDHIANLTLNTKGTKFEVHYRSYSLIEGSDVTLIARKDSSIYYKNGQPWLECRES
ncbi:MAG: hypothetical protein Q4B95_05920 [Lonepinella koalarum]|nr:hypothetical protein [Lonepinella koalarum]